MPGTYGNQLSSPGINSMFVIYLVGDEGVGFFLAVGQHELFIAHDLHVLPWLNQIFSLNIIRV